MPAMPMGLAPRARACWIIQYPMLAPEGMCASRFVCTAGKRPVWTRRSLVNVVITKERPAVCGMGLPEATARNLYHSKFGMDCQGIRRQDTAGSKSVQERSRTPL